MTQTVADSELPGVQQFAQNVMDNLQIAHDAIIDARVSQTFHANKGRRDENVHRGRDVPIENGDRVYLSTENLNLPKGRAKKLLPKFIGPYVVLESRPTTSTYKLELPDDLKRRRIHDTFHISRLRRHEPNDDTMFPHRETNVFYDLGTPNDTEWLVEGIDGHRGRGKTLRFHVVWNLGDETWEPLANVKDCIELDNYLDTQGVKTVADLPLRK